MKQFYTYLHCKPDGTPFYVGKGCGKRSHDFSHGRNQHHRRVVAKYGRKSIGVFIFLCDSEQQAITDEIIQIAQLRKEGYELVNYTHGGEGVSGLRHSPDSIAKMAAAKRGKTASLETRNKMAEAHRGNTYCMGTKQSAETRAKRSAKMKDRPRGKPTIETLAKLSASHVGQPAWNKGKPSPFRGVPRSPETKAKISAAQIGKVLSEEHKKKLSIARKGKAPWNKPT